MASPSSLPSKRSLARPRPSLVANTQQPTSPIPPPIASPLLSPESMLARKASFQQLTQNSLAAVPDGSAEYALSASQQARGRPDYGLSGPSSRKSTEIEVGDIVDTPGGMYGRVRFIGSVKGKAGVFCGVELAGDLVGKGKNDGTVEGVRYFSTSAPLSGIFVPLSRATKRNSITNSAKRPESPGGRSLGGSTLGRAGAKPSFSRPESPVRRPPNARPSLLTPTTPRHVSAAVTGNRMLSPSPTPGKMFGDRGRTVSVSAGPSSDVDSRPGTSSGGGVSRIAPLPKQIGAQLGVRKQNSGASRSAGSPEHRPPEEDLSSPVSTSGGMLPSEDRSEAAEAQIAALQEKLKDRERQLDDQSATLLEMEAALSELQSLIGTAQVNAHNSQHQQSMPRNLEDADASQLRALLREKNERIQQLTQEFDLHRADFRSTIDTLELASTETVRVYEKRMEDLLAENRELLERSEDVESVAQQLKQLEELVAELEEGLEDARRGEAEARGEVEFLRGEVERSKEELRREKEKSAAAIANAAVGSMIRNTSAEEIEKRDEEIAGLKAIIHSLSRDQVSDDDMDHLKDTDNTSHSKGRHMTNGNSNHDSDEELAKERERTHMLEERIKDLEAQIAAKTEREAKLEREIELMERDRRTSIISEKPPAATNNRFSITSEKAFNDAVRPLNSTVTNKELDTVANRDSRATVSSWRSARASQGDVKATSGHEDDDEREQLWCELCEAPGHDILTCTGMFTSSSGTFTADRKTNTITTESASINSTPIDTEREIAPLSFRSPASSPIDTKPGANLDASLATLTQQPKTAAPKAPSVVESNSNAVAGKKTGVVDMSKWCALCERDGHDSVDCPYDSDS